jgi:2-polyprenyl-3-methyl-5-hydroxy-6-metoxy-1,4-benzoquinol methylase
MSDAIDFISRPHCELCGCDHPAILLSKPYTDPAVWDFIQRYYAGRMDKAALEQATYQLARCRVCGFMWQVQILNSAGMVRLYDVWISAENSFQKKQDGDEAAGYGRQTALIRAFMPQKTPADIHVLDFGMGWGYWCMAAQKAGYQVMGMEIAETRLDFARKQGVSAVSRFDELSDQLFDFINAEQVFEHIPKPLDVLNMLVAHLAPKGIVRIAVPDGAKIAQEVVEPDWKASKNAVHPLEHINCFTRQSLAYLGRAAGLAVVAQPVMASTGAKILARSLGISLYRRFFGTVLFFQKP